MHKVRGSAAHARSGARGAEYPAGDPKRTPDVAFGRSLWVASYSLGNKPLGLLFYSNEIPEY